MNRVVIVGGGPTGIAAATLMAQHGVASVVLERWADIYPQPRAVAADDEVFRILARLGIGEDFAKTSRPGLGLRLVEPDLKVLNEFRREVVGVNGYPESNMFDQPVLERLLRDNLAAYPEALLRSDAEVTAIDTLPGGTVNVQFTDRRTGEQESIDADYVLGCDGANSLTRRAIGSTMTGMGFEQRWLVIDIDTDESLGQWDGVHQVCSSVRAGTFMRVTETRYRWEFELLPHETEDDYRTLAEIAPLIRPWAPSLERLNLVRTCEYTFRAQVADRWRRGNIFLLGDAAHLTPPFIGQGMGAGLRDAMNLAWKIAGVCRGALPESMLDTYQRERKPHARSMIRFAVAIGWAMTAGGRRGDFLRTRILPRLQPLAARYAPSATPALRRSALTRRTRVRGDLAGSLCPNVDLGGARLDELVGSRVAVVTCDALPGRQRALLAEDGVAVLEVTAASELGAWLQRGQVTTAVIRPDRAVLTTGSGPRSTDELCFLARTIAKVGVVDHARR
ncbi:bifunctional 3-(3-hydroxy-phenyl)propionate/3-hydroxycinnamic acid hydroxylase [Mycobacterium sp. 236(2023)]|uniref:bifunctional 3-(3-hydroxy-phenyl)propionate/3-hydroxycinnamic acid hydroxylase MhpA n=1 Tax=Mycobacterium sp. 236(2023) TaxID=3038163 RepID=UPI002414EA32|nr:bifunctional 3-(3-hydroxy-phenyl)propionate/3-hydroxycinnamic acid hydroxylase [Mycobacterium sp. 236(2023)]MDG4667254.1 bifunctional 3-(3-hydroxy-phenyl)propionate/3-hydroxycinnamic acid hydroxylase [Mycobacterium sp. 236(2023)]